jgi:hypothetical protein
MKSDLPKLIAQLTKRRVIFRKYLLKASQIVAGEIRTSIKEWVSGTEGRKTGALMRSFRPVLEDKNGELSAGVYSDLPYAAIHEFGGTISANGKKLAIPLTTTARQVYPRSYPGELFVWKSENGNVFLAESRKMKRKNKLRLVYLLRDSVYIKPKGYLDLAATTSAPKIREIMLKALEEIAKT